MAFRPSVTTLLSIVMATALYAGETFEWRGTINSDWNDQRNWDPNDQGYPGQSANDDVVIIESVNTNQPTFNVAGTIILQSLTINDTGTDPVLTFENTVLDARTITLTDPVEPLHIGQNCRLLMYNASALNIPGQVAGAMSLITLEGEITFKERHEQPIYNPQISFGVNGPDSSVFRITGGGMIRGGPGGYGRLVSASGDNSEKYATVILDEDAAIHGTVQIGVLLINNGLVDPNDPVDIEHNGNTIYLTCTPMTGVGKWWATNSATESDTHNVLDVGVAITSFGNIKIGENGEFQVHGHISHTGPFLMEQEATLVIDRGIMFDVNRWAKICDY